VNHKRGFTLLEVLVATVIMGIAVGGALNGLAAASRIAVRLTQYDRATLLARQKMDQLLVDQHVPRNIPFEGGFDPSQIGGSAAGYRGRVLPFETAAGAGPGNWVLDRIQLEIWWMDGATRHSFMLEGYRRSLLQAGDLNAQ
jgi:general secretion pathway protein I